VDLGSGTLVCQHVGISKDAVGKHVDLLPVLSGGPLGFRLTVAQRPVVQRSAIECAKSPGCILLNDHRSRDLPNTRLPR